MERDALIGGNVTNKAEVARLGRHLELSMLKLLSIAAFLVMVAGIIGLWETGALFSPSPLVIGAQCAAVALMIWARVTLGRRSFHPGANPTAGGLVTSGPYHFIRHPIYTAACLFVGAGVLAHWSVVAAGWWRAGLTGRAGANAVRGAFNRRGLSRLPRIFAGY